MCQYNSNHVKTGIKANPEMSYIWNTPEITKMSNIIPVWRLETMYCKNYFQHEKITEQAGPRSEASHLYPGGDRIESQRGYPGSGWEPG
jgi:hypothetical protein